MPRKARIDASGALHHIIIRGIERKAIFKDKADRANFVERLGRVVSEIETGCYAWVLMPNHVHLLLKTGLSPIATVMRRLLTGYAVSLYFLRLFGQSTRNARRGYESFVSKGVGQGRRPELVGGGLLRSVGGWSALKGFRDIGVRIKGDERLLGSSDFVERVLKQANEQLKEKYRLQGSKNGDVRSISLFCDFSFLKPNNHSLVIQHPFLNFVNL